jgi:hypothetical protein
MVIMHPTPQSDTGAAAQTISDTELRAGYSLGVATSHAEAKMVQLKEDTVDQIIVRCSATGFAFIINVAKRPPVGITHDETVWRDFGGPRCREAAFRHVSF